MSYFPARKNCRQLLFPLRRERCSAHNLAVRQAGPNVTAMQKPQHDFTGDPHLI